MQRNIPFYVVFILYLFIMLCTLKYCYFLPCHFMRKHICGKHNSNRKFNMPTVARIHRCSGHVYNNTECETVADPGFPRRGSGGRGATYYFGQFFLKLHENGRKKIDGWGVGYLLDLPMWKRNSYQWVLDNLSSLIRFRFHIHSVWKTLNWQGRYFFTFKPFYIGSALWSFS